jgi:tetratricopeptide (TPR) repeat protein
MLARLYEKRGNFTQAIALWELVRRTQPEDVEAQHKIKDLAAHETIARGQYESAIGSPSGREETGEEGTADDLAAATAVGDSPLPAPASPEAAERPVLDRVGREAAPLRARLKTDPTNVNLYLQIAALYRRADQLDQARAVLQEGLGPTGNAFELAAELADVEIEPFRQNLAITEEKLGASPDDGELRKIRIRLRKEVNTRELELYRMKAERYPTEMGYRYEVGVRLLRAGQTDEAIRELQAARSDPRFRAQSLHYLGLSFKARNNWRLAQRNFEEALQFLPASEVARRKDLLFELAQGAAEAGEFARAIDWGSDLANLDFSCHDIGRLLDEWQTRLQQQANVPR